MRRRIIRDPDAERAGQDAIHSGVCGQDGAACLEPLPQLGLEMARHGDDDGGGPEARQVIDEFELLLWFQRRLQDDHIVTGPGAGASLGWTELLHRCPEALGRGKEALHEQKFVGYYEQTPRHGCRIAGRGRSSALLAIAKSDLALAIIAPGESWVEGQADHSGETSEIQRQEKGDSP
jgi:hypothetical protein